MFIHEFSYWRTPRLPQHQANKPLEPPARLRWFNEFYLLDKSVTLVMGENKRSSSPHFNPVRAQRRLSPWRRQPPRATVGARPSQGEGRGIGQGHWAARTASLLELPLLAAHGAVLLHLLRVQPLEDAVHVEAM